MADIFLKTHGMVLDYSSIGKEVRFFSVSYGKKEKIIVSYFFSIKMEYCFSQSLIYNILSNNDENDGGQNATAIKLDYLAKKTKNNKYLVKNECPSGLLDKIYGASPKYVSTFCTAMNAFILQKLFAKKKITAIIYFSFAHPSPIPVMAIGNT